jgi:hypothetical protein
MWRVLVVVAAGCGRLDFDPVAQGDLVAHYTMDAIDGGRLVDVTGHGHDGACTACPVPTAGIVNGALRFDEASTLVLVPGSTDFALATMTLALWVRIDAAPPGPAFDCFASKPVGTMRDNSWQFCVTPQDQLYLVTRSGGQPDAQFLKPLMIGVWHHLALTMSSGVETVIFDGGSAFSKPVGPYDFDGGDLVLGGDLNSGLPLAYFGGALDDVRLYDRALSLDELAILATRP